MKEHDTLIGGAKRCLQERGSAHTTARDIARTSGANLASIGYQFGSKDAPLAEAMVEAIAEWTDKLRQAMAGEVPREGMRRCGSRRPSCSTSAAPFSWPASRSSLRPSADRSCANHWPARRRPPAWS
ncbi:TetR/AcrR family transcriptional regulator [Nonomuraea soli]|uniref:AcrR family transcriptional regulator n=1 Tax=Nonomuraea soli TaxID=1032476 RepID=A0A7W0HQX5_9ACTN|nr:TetR family transcriptional regulator [Nonomuraea soli]MBA2892345.1 AcrR family transcriptional regulator [Nonomuraea soli]